MCVHMHTTFGCVVFNQDKIFQLENDFPCNKKSNKLVFMVRIGVDAVTEAQVVRWIRQVRDGDALVADDFIHILPKIKQNKS